MSDFTAKLSERATKKLFFNAEHDEDTKRVFAQAVVSVEKPKELAPEPKPVNPYQALDDRNRAMDQARIEAAKVSDPTMVLIKEPGIQPAAKVESVTLEQLPAVVRQAAEAAVLKRLKRHRA